MPDGIVHAAAPVGTASLVPAGHQRPLYGRLSAAGALCAPAVPQGAQNGPQGRPGASQAKPVRAVPSRLDACVTLPGEPTSPQAAMGHPKPAAGSRRPAPDQLAEVTHD